MTLPWKSGESNDAANRLDDKQAVDVEFERSVADEPERPTDRDPLDRDRHYGGEPLLDRPTEVDPQAEAEEWERRYGTEESRNKLGFDGEPR